MDCVSVTKVLSDADGRVSRRRDIRAHLRDCPSCTAFQADIKGRTRDLAALSPLPAVLGAGLLKGVLGSGGAASGGGGLGAGAGGAIGSVALKATATVAVVAALGAGADRAHLVDLGLPGGNGGTSATKAVEAAPAAETTDAEGAAPADIDGRAVKAAAGTEGAARLGDGAAVAKRARAGEQPAPGPVAAEKGTDAEAPGHSQGQARGRGAKPALPAASAHGQETAAAHKNANHGRSAEHPAKPAHPAHPPPPPKPAKPAKPEKPATAQDQPETSGDSAEAAPEAEKPAPGSGNGKKPVE